MHSQQLAEDVATPAVATVAGRVNRHSENESSSTNSSKIAKHNKSRGQQQQHQAQECQSTMEADSSSRKVLQAQKHHKQH